MYKVSQVIEQAPTDYSPSEWISFCNQLKGNTAIAWSFGDYYMDAYDAQCICLDAYLHQFFTGKLSFDILKRDYNGKTVDGRMKKLDNVIPWAYEVSLAEIFHKLAFRLGFTYSGNNPININDDDYIKRTFSPERIPFHLPQLIERYGQDESKTGVWLNVRDWFESARMIVEVQ